MRCFVVNWLNKNNQSISPTANMKGMLEFLPFLDTEKVYLSGMNVMQVLYLAEKYSVPNLTKRGNSFLNLNLDTSNVFSVLKHADFFSNDHLASDCWYFCGEKCKRRFVQCRVSRYYNNLLNSPWRGFSELNIDIERSVLENVVARDMLNVEEVLFKAVDCWAVKECERQNIEAEGPVKRLLLWEEIIQKMRFPVMRKDVFMDVVV